MTTRMTDLAVQRALMETEELPPLTVEDLPLVPMFWHIIVEPLVPKKQTQSGLIISDGARKVEQIQNTVGRVLIVGPLAFGGTTSSGLQLSRDDNARNLKAGDYVLFARYTGQEVKFTKENHDRTIIILSDTELLALVRDPSVIRFWI